ncbi:hypothetical protein PHYSODRAFT_510634, partial [Phytophthora sojae]
MLQGLELTDAVSLKYQLDEEDVDHDPLHHYSFWRKDGASRLDRFYLVADIQNLIRDTSRQDRKQTQRYFENLRAATRKPTASRAEHQKDLDAAARLRAARSFGDSIQQSPETARKLFKRNSEWQRDQHISRIDPSPGHFYPDAMPSEERMASEWNHVFGASHASVDSSSLEEEFTRFVQIPVEKRLRRDEVAALLAPITEAETIAAIQQLPRHKAGGTTGLNHDFFKDFADELSPSMTRLYNAIFKGSGVP